MGAMVGRLTHAASIHLNLPQGTLVVQGGPDAFVGMIGLGCIHAGQLCLITGSSHLQCVVTSNMTTSREIWGPYKGAPLPNMMFAEGGQSSTGSTLRWAKNLFGGTDTISYKTLDDEAAVIPPGAHGLVALATFQGQRTPTTDPFLRGAFVGLTLSHTRGHIWRALLEAVCYGTRACIEGLTRAGHPCTEIIIAGGVTRSRLWLQMHADVTGKTVIVCENSDAPLLGCAILASVGAGIHKSVLDGVNAMVRTSERIEPDPEMAAQYDRFYTDIYSKVPEAVRPISRALYSVLSLQGGETKRHDSSVHATSSTLGKDEQAAKSTNRRTIVISPSLLACDWTRIGEEVRKCLLAGATRLHVDIFVSNKRGFIDARQFEDNSF
jgi:ribulose kinase